MQLENADAFITSSDDGKSIDLSDVLENAHESTVYRFDSRKKKIDSRASQPENEL